MTLHQAVAADRIPSNTGQIRTPNIEIPANLGNLGVKPRQQIIASDVVSKGNGDGHAQKENSHTAEDKIKGNNYNYFIEALHGNYGGERKGMSNPIALAHHIRSNNLLFGKKR